MNKLIIPIIITVILAVVIGAYFIFSNNNNSTGPVNPEAGNTQDYSLDADGFLWGTEATGHEQATIDAINQALKTKYVKFRISSAFCTRDWKSFTTNCGIPTLSNPKGTVNLDDIVKIFEENHWSMIPMISYSQPETGILLKASTDIDNYVNFVEWFMQNYRGKANIKYVELENSPNMDSARLLEANNKVYDAIKNRYSDVLVGTPGFEYWDDPANVQNQIAEIEYFLDKNNGAKFDFWAFHGYAMADVVDIRQGKVITFPPTKTARSNKYAGIPGIKEIRKKMDANGWQDRLIIDAEHSFVLRPGSPITQEADNLNAAYMVQELLLKRTLQLNNKLVLAGAIPFKTCPRKSIGEFAFGNLYPDGSLTKTIKAVALLWSKLNEYKYDSHISGEFDNENQVWIEKFKSGSNKEVYIFFKPFKYYADQSITLDNQTLNYTLYLTKNPSSITLTYADGSTENIISRSQSIILEAENTPKFLEIEY